MEKPKSEQINLFDYTECSEYIFKKHNISEKDKKDFC